MSALLDDVSQDANYKLTGNVPRKFLVIQPGNPECVHYEVIIKVKDFRERGECRHCHRVKEYWEEVPDKIYKAKTQTWLNQVLNLR